MSIEQLEQTVIELQTTVADLVLVARGYNGSRPKVDALNRIDGIAARLTAERETPAPQPENTMLWK